MDATTEGLEETGTVRALGENKLEGAEGGVVIVAVMKTKVRLGRHQDRGRRRQEGREGGTRNNGGTMVLVIQIETRITRLVVLEVHDDRSLGSSIAVEHDATLHKVKENADPVPSIIGVEIVAHLFALVPQ